MFPQGMTYDFQGESRQFVTEGNTLAITFGFALIIIYLVLAAQFESFRDPFIILIGLPASIFGALFVLFILGEVNGMMQNQSPINLGSGTINIYTQIGLVTLIGLISKHGILMVEFANKLQEQGLDKFSAIKEAAAVRLRPILMTTAAMVIGVVPLLIADGAGAKSRFDIGLVIAAGMTIGTMFTLFITPVVYTYRGARPPQGCRGPRRSMVPLPATRRRRSACAAEVREAAVSQARHAGRSRIKPAPRPRTSLGGLSMLRLGLRKPVAAQCAPAPFCRSGLARREGQPMQRGRAEGSARDGGHAMLSSSQSHSVSTVSIT